MPRRCFLPLVVHRTPQLSRVISWIVRAATVNSEPCQPLAVKDHHRICSDHFVSEKPSKDRDNGDYMPTVFNDRQKRLVARSNPERADRATKRRKHIDEVNEVASILVDISTSSVDVGKVRSDNEEVIPMTTDNLPSSGDDITRLNMEVVLLKARVQS